MIKHLALASFLFSISVMTQLNANPASWKLVEEFERLRTEVSRLQPDNSGNSYYREKDYGDHIIMWKLENQTTKRPEHQYEEIRLYIKSTGTHPPFDVTYHKTTAIVRGILVLRKFIGPEPHGWRNDTVNYMTGEYLGFQGASHINLPNHVKNILTQWSITPFLF